MHFSYYFLSFIIYLFLSLPVIPAFVKLRQEDHEVKPSLGYIARYCLRGWGRGPGGGACLEEEVGGAEVWGHSRSYIEFRANLARKTLCQNAGGGVSMLLHTLHIGCVGCFQLLAPPPHQAPPVTGSHSLG